MGALAALAIWLSGASAQATDRQAVLATYADIAQAGYQDSLRTAEGLRRAVDALIQAPSERALTTARQAWIAARRPYMQTEVFRFGNAVVDDWEGKVNAWPLDEGLIDYVDASYGSESAGNPGYAANVVANPSLTIGGETIDAERITAALLEEQLQELGGVEANVATGYHAVEFLLWGQDLNGTGAGAGARPWTDYARGEDCTGGNCERRAEYLSAATRLLVDDLEWMAGQWAEGGAAREALLEDPAAGIAAILTGMGSLSYGEMAGERMKLGLMLHDPEEEHDCFSDTTHLSHYFDILGILNVYAGSYTRIDGRKVAGPAVSHLVAAADPALNAELYARLRATEQAAAAMMARAEAGEAYDQMLAADNPEGNATIQAVVDALTAQTQAIEKAVAALGLQPIAFEGSDSLDDPEAVFQ